MVFVVDVVSGKAKKLCMSSFKEAIEGCEKSETDIATTYKSECGEYIVVVLKV